MFTKTTTNSPKYRPIDSYSKEEMDDIEKIFKISISLITQAVWNATIESKQKNIKLFVWGGSKKANAGLLYPVIVIMTHLSCGIELKDLQNELDKAIPEYEGINKHVCEILCKVSSLKVLKKIGPYALEAFLEKTFSVYPNKVEWQVDLKKGEKVSQSQPILPWGALTTKQTEKKAPLAVLPFKFDPKAAKPQATIILFTHKKTVKKSESLIPKKTSDSKPLPKKTSDSKPLPIDYKILAQNCSAIAIKQANTTDAPKVENKNQPRMQRR